MEGSDNSNAMAEEAKSSALKPIETLIHVIRGLQVMLDSDLARLYGVETRVLNQAVKRNIERFPNDFMFQLTKDESQNLMSGSKSQIVILKDKRGSNFKYQPYVFTENGVAMLSGVLRSEAAIEVNIRIMRAFTAMRNFMTSNAHVFQRLEAVEHHQLLLQRHQSETDMRIDEVLTRLESKEAEPIEGFFFDGQIFDAYALVSDLVRKALRRIVLIDNYVDDKVLRVLDKRGDDISATIYTDPRHSHISLDLSKHNAQYPHIEVRNCANVHDRFLIVDDAVYFIGGSIKDLGKKIVAFSRMSQNPDDIIANLR